MLSPGISLKYDSIPGYSPEVQSRMPHAWTSGTQVQLLRDQCVAALAPSTLSKLALMRGAGASLLACGGGGGGGGGAPPAPPPPGARGGDAQGVDALDGVADVRVDEQAVDLGVDVLDGDLEPVEGPGLRDLHLRHEAHPQVLQDDAVRAGEERQDVLDEVPLGVREALPLLGVGWPLVQYDSPDHWSESVDFV
mgnify:CR=1 FL=1